MAAQAFGEKNLSREMREGRTWGLRGGEEERGYMRLLLERDGERERGEFTVYNIILSPVTVVSGWEDQTTLPYQAGPSPAMCFQQRDFFIHRADYKAMLDDFNPSLFDVGAATTPAFPGFCFSNFLSPTPPFSFFSLFLRAPQTWSSQPRS